VPKNFLFVSNFTGHTGDPGYEGFIIGTKGENGERGDMIIKVYIILIYVTIIEQSV